MSIHQRNFINYTPIILLKTSLDNSANFIGSSAKATTEIIAKTPSNTVGARPSISILKYQHSRVMLKTKRVSAAVRGSVRREQLNL